MLSEVCGQFPVTAFTQGLPNLLEPETFQRISKSFFKYIRMYMENNLRKNPKISAAFRIHKVSVTVQRGKVIICCFEGVRGHIYNPPFLIISFSASFLGADTTTTNITFSETWPSACQIFELKYARWVGLEAKFDHLQIRAFGALHILFVRRLLLVKFFNQHKTPLNYFFRSSEKPPPNEYRCSSYISASFGTSKSTFNGGDVT